MLGEFSSSRHFLQVPPRTSRRDMGTSSLILDTFHAACRGWNNSYHFVPHLAVAALHSVRHVLPHLCLYYTSYYSKLIITTYFIQQPNLSQSDTLLSVSVNRAIKKPRGKWISNSYMPISTCLTRFTFVVPRGWGFEMLYPILNRYAHWSRP